VAITDQFGTQSYTLKKITKLCTPVNKNGEDATAPQHVGHLVCYQAKLPAGAKFAPQTVSVNNANFGPAVLVAKAVLEASSVLQQNEDIKEAPVENISNVSQEKWGEILEKMTPQDFKYKT
jgi:hypothetical protein